MRDLRLALLQRATAWHDQANRSDLEASLALLPAGLDVVLLAEMFTTGFTMETETQGKCILDRRWLGSGPRPRA